MTQKIKKVVKKKTSKRISKKAIKHKVIKKISNKKIVESKNEVFYMGISNPIEIRKNILESARDMVQFLQMFEKFRIIREEKKQATILLKKHIKELNILTNKLKVALPKTSFRTKSKTEETPEIKEPQKIEIIEEEPKKSEIPDIDIDDIEALESELKEIEDKLNFL